MASDQCCHHGCPDSDRRLCYGLHGNRKKSIRGGRQSGSGKTCGTSADSGTGVGIEFTGITACVLSGVALKGGEGTLWKVIVAAFVLGVLSNGMQLINLGTYPQYIAKGVIMLLSLYLTNRNAQGM